MPDGRRTARQPLQESTAERVRTGSRDLYRDPRFYAQLYRRRRDDVRFYVGLGEREQSTLPKPLRVLEYGCGEGRVTIPLAAHGFQVTGVDLARPMLARLAERAERAGPTTRGRISTRRADMRRLRLDSQFDVVLAPFNVLLHLYTSRDIEAFLGRVRQHLRPRGLFAFDFSLPDLDHLAADPDELYRARPFRHATTGLRVGYAESFEYLPEPQILLTTMHFIPSGRQVPFRVLLSQRQFFPREVRAWLAYAGFVGTQLLADFTAEPANAATDSVGVTCRAP